MDRTQAAIILQLEQLDELTPDGENGNLFAATYRAQNVDGNDLGTVEVVGWMDGDSLVTQLRYIDS